MSQPEPERRARTETAGAAVPPAWWRDGVIYQIYPRSFADSDGDGIGDLRGITERLDHLAWLGVDGIWLNPTFPSPNADWGYDVADYTAVHPELGTLEDLEALIAAAAERGIRVLLDLVPNHTSDRHAWFEDALTGREATHRDHYVWADPRPDGSPPNNWLSVFGGSGWEWHEATGQYYFHNFLPEQPDLDWWNPAVREAFEDILRFWYDRGIAGFRIDVVHAVIKDRELRDNPAPTADAHPEQRELAQVPVFSMNRPEVHDVIRSWRTLSDGYDPQRMLVGESYVLELEQLIAFYGTGEDELNLAFNFLFVHAALTAHDLRTVVEGVEAMLPAAAWPVYTGSNHDVGRLVRRWAQGDERRARCALLMLLTLRGTPFLYYGDEIALPEVPTPNEQARDPVGRTSGRPERNRDGCRSPMLWEPGPGGGFTAPGVETWLPLGDPSVTSVAAQREDRGSTLHLVRDLIALRRREADLHAGPYRTLPAPEGAWAWARGDGWASALNLSDAEVAIEGLDGTVALGTNRARDGESVAGAVRLGPWEGVVLARA